jgi:hypothetical protein
MKTKAETAREIQNNLQCNHCKSIFTGTLAQALRLVYEGRSAYCSDICRKAFLSEKFSKPIPNKGACVGCGNEFFSRRDAKFCGMKCYTGSQQFSDMLKDSREKSLSPASVKKRAEKSKKGEDKPCLECGADVYVKKSNIGRKFCSKPCYRSYMAKRFDRHIANPESISLPQGYDAFLDKELLTCPIDGCDWQGHWLSLHLNQMHGITAAEYKRAAGFNKGSAIVSRPMAMSLHERGLQGVALDSKYWSEKGVSQPKWVSQVFTKEGSEHSAKSRALAGHGPTRCCTGCGQDFVQSTPFGKSMFCTKDCRGIFYAAKEKLKRINAKALT